MNESPGKFHVNPAFEDNDKPTSLKCFQLKVLTNQTEEYGHSNHDHCHQYEVLNFDKVKPARGSNRARLALVIIVCLISVVALLLTLLMLVGKIGSSNEGSYADSAKSQQTDLAKIKALEENMTSLQLGLVANTKELESVPSSLQHLQEKMVDLDTAFTELRTHLNKTDNEPAELKKVKPSAHIVASYVKSVGYSINTVIKDWSASDPHSHLEGGMKYQDGKLTVPKTGRYCIYAQLFFKSEGRVRILVNNDFVSLIKSPGPETTASGIGVFVLNTGDTISLQIDPWGAPDDSSVKFWMKYNHCYFGAFLI